MGKIRALALTATILGGCIGFVSVLLVYLASGLSPSDHPNQSDYRGALIIASIPFIASLIGFYAFALLVKNNLRRAGRVLVIIGVLNLWPWIFSIVPGILFIVAGIKCKKLLNESNQGNPAFIPSSS